MKRSFVAASLIAALSVAAVPAVAQQSSQLAQALENRLILEGIHGVDTSALSVSELAVIKSILDTEEPSVNLKSQVLAVID